MHKYTGWAEAGERVRAGMGLLRQEQQEKQHIEEVEIQRIGCWDTNWV